MRVKPISRTIKATALTNPDPSFVSQVKAGANQKPWRAVKMDGAVPVDDNPEDSMKIKSTQKAASAVVAAVAPKGYGVMQFQFAKAAFADEAAVTSWMEAGGYHDFEVTTTTKGFEVMDDEARFVAGSVSKIEGFHEGVVAFVGKLTNPELGDDEQPAADAVDTAKAAADAIAAAANPVVDPPARTRSAGAPEGDEQPEAAAAEPAAEPTPVEAPEEQPAGEPAPVPAPAPVAEPEAAPATDATKAAAIIVRADHVLKEKGVNEAARLGEIVNSLGWIVYDAEYTGLSEETVTKIKTAANALLEAFMQAAQDAATELTDVFKSAEELAARSEPAPVEQNLTDIDAIVAAAVSKAIAPLADRVTTAEAAVTQANEATATAQRELAERVEADNARGQTRKGADDPLAPESTGKDEAKRSQASTNILSSFGSRHAR